MINKGSFVQIKKIIKPAEERSNKLPLSTQNQDLVMLTKGFLKDDAKIGDWVKITTLANRIEEGTLINENHIQKVDFGSFVPELLAVGIQVKKELQDV